MRKTGIYVDWIPNALLTFAVAVFFNIPDGVLLVQHLVCHYFMLPEAPVWQLPPRELQTLTRVEVNQANLENIIYCLNP